MSPMTRSIRSTVRMLRSALVKTWWKFRFIGVDHDKLHLGSGKVVIPGWYNIDLDPQSGSKVHKMDLSNPLPFPDASVSMIFSEHLIEHMPKNKGLRFLKECYRVLRAGGTMRFGWPDFSKHIEAYNTKDKKYREGMLKHMKPGIVGTWDEFFADLLYSWGHRYMYTPELLTEFFKAAGFEKVKIKKYGQSSLGYSWDTRDDPDTTYIEAEKLI